MRESHEDRVENRLGDIVDGLSDLKNALMNEQTQTTDEKLDCWAVVELMGHNKIAGKIKEVSIAGGAMLRVDVPASGEQKSYTRFFGHSSIYSINPTTEELATAMVRNCASEPVRRYELPKLAEINPQTAHDTVKCDGGAF